MASEESHGEPFQNWAEDMIRILIEDIQETKKDIRETKRLTKETRVLAQEAKRTADAAWELVILTREELKEMKKPWWKKLFGMNGK